MSEEPANAGDAGGRPSSGQALASSVADAAGRRAKSRNVGALSRLTPFVGAHWGDALLASLFLLVSSGATLSLSGAVRLLVDHFNGAPRHDWVDRGFILSLDPEFFLRTRVGEVLSRLTADIQIVETLVGSSVSIALRNLVMLVGALVWMTLVSGRLTGLVLLLIPVVLLPLFTFGRQVRRLTASTQDQFAEAVGYAGETLDALETVQAFGREGAAGERFGDAVEAAFRTSLKRMRARALMTALVITLVFGGVVAIFWLGVHAVLAGEITLGVLFQFAILSVLAASSVGQLGETWGDVQKAAGAMERIGEILDSRPKVAAPAEPRPLPVPARGQLSIEDVTFAYPGRPELPALKGFSLSVRPGERVALVGPSGAGKSTVLRLLLRFYDPQAGRILFDGVDLRDTDVAELRARMALVAQDSPLFSGTAAENVRFGRAEASDEEVRAAVRAAQAESFLNALPEGFETRVGERARSLSGGQRQRLAIARALVREAPVLLLDEATSALDAENERLVQVALDRAMARRTTLVIAHRLATVLKADRIVVMDEGRVVEQGSHGELVARSGLYAKLAALQFGEAA
jgi:ATP-binding cassette subfamily B protein